MTEIKLMVQKGSCVTLCKIILLLSILSLLCQPLLAQRAQDPLLDSAQLKKDEGNFREAIAYYERYREKMKAQGDWEKYIFRGMSIGNILLLELNAFSEAFDSTRSLMKLCKEKLGEEHPYNFYLENNHGNNFRVFGNYDSALFLYSKSLQSCRRILGEEHLSNAVILNSIGSIHLLTGDDRKAETYYQTALDLRIKQGEEPYKLSQSYMNLAISQNTSSLAAAYNNFQKALTIREKKFGSSHRFTAIVYGHMAVHLLNRNELDSAIDYQRKSLAAYQHTFKGYQNNKVNAMKQLARLLILNGDLGKAKKLLNEAIELCKSAGVFQSKELTRINYWSAFLHFKLGELSKASSYIGKSMEINEGALGVSNILDIDLYVNSLKLKLLVELKTQAFLKGGFQTVNKCLDVLEENVRISGEPDFVQEGHLEVLSEMINLLNQANIENGESIAKEQVVRLILRYRSLVFNRLLDYRRLKQQQLSEEHLATEKKLKLEMDELKSQVLDAQKTSTKSDSLKKLLFTAQVRVDSVNKSIGERFPKLDYYTEIQRDADLDVVQKDLGEDELLVEFVESDSLISVVTFTKDTISVRLLDKVGRLREVLSVNSSESFIKLDNASLFYLYDQLLQPSLVGFNGNKIAIVPDGSLWNVNFDVLLTSNIPGTDFSSLPYLIKKYAISYRGTSGIRKFKKNRANPAKNAVLAFSFGEQSGGGRIKLSDYRSSPKELPGSVEEVRAISEIFEGDFYFGESASKAQFKETASNYQILHLALHGETNENLPEYSKLSFFQKNENESSGALHSFEIYHLDLNADLAVLSACETGSGKVVNGEGVMSLGRAFSWAGVRGLLLTRWEVSDAVTPVIMKEFYLGIKSGLDRSEALRKAKLKIIEETDGVISDPQYWSSFYVYGDDSPILIDKANSYGWFWVILVLGIILSFGWYLIGKRKILKKEEVSS